MPASLRRHAAAGERLPILAAPTWPGPAAGSRRVKRRGFALINLFPPPPASTLASGGLPDSLLLTGADQRHKPFSCCQAAAPTMKMQDRSLLTGQALPPAALLHRRHWDQPLQAPAWPQQPSTKSRADKAAALATKATQPWAAPAFWAGIGGPQIPASPRWHCAGGGCARVQPAFSQAKGPARD